MAATTTTTSAPAARPAAMPKGNPKDSMKSTWRRDRSNWNGWHYLMHFARLHPTNLKQSVPKHEKTDKMPYITKWSANAWVIGHAIWPMAIQWAYYLYAGTNLHWFPTFILYTAAYQINAVHHIDIVRRLGHRFGFLDGDKHERDEVPDVGVAKAFISLIGITTIRPLYTTFLTYRRDEPPTLSWWLPVELALYSIVLDFWFYLYHRSCHELDNLWKYHRTHHLTKHPNVMLSSYADPEQELIEMVIVPMLTYLVLKLLGMPMGFYDTWFCLEFLLFSEAFGHSGVRVYITPPGTSTFILEPFDCELVTEDHDLHHRKGWRNSYNYGKQTRLWDRIFGTCHERVECLKSNVDWDNRVNFPMF